MKRILLLTAAVVLASPALAGERDCRGLTPAQCRAQVEGRVVRRPAVDYNRVNRILDAEIIRRSRRTECLGIDFGGGISTLSCD